TAEQLEGNHVLGSLGAAAVVVLPAMGIGAVVATFRRVLFRPDLGVARMALIHLATGLVYAVACAAASASLAAVLDIEVEGVPSGRLNPAMVIAYGFLYVILAAFLAWTESVARVQESRAAAAREAVLRAEAEARAVRAQFNPHFVFNVLHSLMLLVRAEPERAERAIEDVAGLIRYASRLQREERDVVPLEEEIAFARRYLALEKLRLAERLRVGWEIDDALSETPVPAFGLQTLLENAVKHGVAPRPEGGRVTVTAVRVDDSLSLVVEDDGPGNAGAGEEDGDGQGLRLLRDRVRMLHGSDGMVHWSEGDRGGFRTEIRVPLP
ncbi:MAG: histidine kinase, partial [Gemmatimonadota bacterium]|nr:histidine kinase [Gemmatimonadota bacterium]